MNPLEKWRFVVGNVDVTLLTKTERYTECSSDQRMFNRLPLKPQHIRPTQTLASYIVPSVDQKCPCFLDTYHPLLSSSHPQCTRRVARVQFKIGKELSSLLFLLQKRSVVLNVFEQSLRKPAARDHRIVWMIPGETHTGTIVFIDDKRLTNLFVV